MYVELIQNSLNQRKKYCTLQFVEWQLIDFKSFTLERKDNNKLLKVKPRQIICVVQHMFIWAFSYKMPPLRTSILFSTASKTGHIILVDKLRQVTWKMDLIWHGEIKLQTPFLIGQRSAQAENADIAELRAKWRKGMWGKWMSHYGWTSSYLLGMRRWRYAAEESGGDSFLYHNGAPAVAPPSPPLSSPCLSPTAHCKYWPSAPPPSPTALPLCPLRLVLGQESSL